MDSFLWIKGVEKQPNLAWQWLSFPRLLSSQGKEGSWEGSQSQETEAHQKTQTSKTNKEAQAPKAHQEAEASKTHQKAKSTEAYHNTND